MPPFLLLRRALLSFSRSLAILHFCLCQSASRLEKLDRHPQLQALYVDEFFPAVKAAYGSTEAFLMQRLDWNADTVQNARMSGQMFARDISSDWVRVARNDWAYGAPRDFVCGVCTYTCSIIA